MTSDAQDEGGVGLEGIANVRDDLESSLGRRKSSPDFIGGTGDLIIKKKQINKYSKK